MSDVVLDWSSAEVDDGTLDVPLRGGLAREWKVGFKQTVALLPGGNWGTVKLKKDRVRVHDVSEGREDDLRHFLEGVVLQANATCDAQRDTDAGEVGDADAAEPDSRDVEMTARFRSFAAEPEQ